MQKTVYERFPLSGEGGWALPLRTLSLVALALVLFAIFGEAPEALVFDRAAIADGEIWRLITAHWVHTDPYHVFWNITALVLLGVLFERCLQWHLILSLIVGMVVVDLWLWWGSADLSYYCGLSGILNSLLIVGLVRFWFIHAHPLIPFVMLGVVIKTGIEMFTAQALFTTTAWPSVPGAHAAGFLGGLALVIFLFVWSRADAPV